MGFKGLTSNALASVGLFIQIPVSFLFSYVSDRFNRRGETVITGLSMAVLAYVFNRIFTEIRNQGAQYFGVIWTQTFGTFSHPLNISWMSLTCTDSEERALAMAMVIMGANLAGIYGAQIFRSDDKPRYRRAFSVAIAVLATGTVLAIVRKIDEKINGKKGGGQDVDEDERSDGQTGLYDDIKAAPSEVPPAPALVDGHGRASISGTTK